jgi:hypothetical protein
MQRGTLGGSDSLHRRGEFTQSPTSAAGPCGACGETAACAGTVMSCLDVYGPRPIATGLAKAGRKVTTADVYPAS